MLAAWTEKSLVLPLDQSYELGVVQRRRGIFSISKTTAWFKAKGGKPQFLLKQSNWFLFLGSTTWDSYSPEDARKLKDALAFQNTVYETLPVPYAATPIPRLSPEEARKLQDASRAMRNCVSSTGSM